jgi:hypothetical protein
MTLGKPVLDAAADSEPPGPDNAPVLLRSGPRRSVIAMAVAATILIASAAYSAQEPSSVQTGGQLLPVDPSEASEAVSTMTGSTAQLATVAENAKSCKVALAMILIAKSPGTAGGSVRFFSGTYASPYFVLTETPQRVAIPYPRPYQSGRGTISVFGEATGATVSLRPVWSIGELHGQATENVWWPVDNNCGGTRKRFAVLLGAILSMAPFVIGIIARDARRAALSTVKFVIVLCLLLLVGGMITGQGIFTRGVDEQTLWIFAKWIGSVFLATVCLVICALVVYGIKALIRGRNKKVS